MTPNYLSHLVILNVLTMHTGNRHEKKNIILLNVPNFTKVYNNNYKIIKNVGISFNKTKKSNI